MVHIADTAPREPAVVHGSERIAYRTLADAAAVHATRLSSWGVGRGDVVPLVMVRGAALIALELGVLMCGAAYTGIDPRWPAARIESILGQIDGSIVVGAQGAVGVTRTVEPSAVADTAAEIRTLAPLRPVDVGSDHPATVFFTSGTTGVSKGVVVPHRAVTRMFGPGGLEGFGPGHVTPQAAPVPWDMYAFEVWGQLTTGGTVVVVDEDHLMPRRLRSLIAHEGADTIWLTTSLFNLFVDEDLDSFAGAQRLYIGGEKQSPRHVAAFLRGFPDLPIWNCYGPAENCMLTTIHRMSPDDLDVAGGIPVGTAVPGTEVVLLDNDGMTVPPNTPGEIVVAGSGVALGYLNDAALTGERFVSLDLAGESMPGYRTGDIGLVDSQGLLHYRGRRDRQIKLNGNRIELGDIEAAAARLPQIRTCAAVARSGSEGRVEAIALVYTLVEGVELSAREVRKHMSVLLPRYAIPGIFEQVDALPRSANGKLNLQALSLRPPV